MEQVKVNLHTLTKELDKMSFFRTFVSGNQEINKDLKLDTIKNHIGWFYTNDGSLIVVETKDNSFELEIIGDEVVMTPEFITYYNNWKEEKDTVALTAFVNFMEKGLSI